MVKAVSEKEGETHRVGDRVRALYSDGQAYPATIAAANAGGCYVVDWDDGDERCRERNGAQIFPLREMAAAAARQCAGGRRRRPWQRPQRSR